MKQLIIIAFLVTVLNSGCTEQITKEAQMSKNECVILLHGLFRTSRSMHKMERSLESQGYTVNNVDYPSRKHPIETLTEQVIPSAVQQCQQIRPEKIHFVTHSMGGILLRYYLSQHTIKILGRVVMLSPPNQGSEVVDKLKWFPPYQWLNGPAGQQLGTDPDSIPLQLGPATFEVGIITGNRTINLINSLLIPGRDDGKVSIQNAKLEGMRDFLIVPHTHPLIMNSDRVIQQTTHFLEYGKFKPAMP